MKTSRTFKIKKQIGAGKKSRRQQQRQRQRPRQRLPLPLPEVHLYLDNIEHATTVKFNSLCSLYLRSMGDKNKDSFTNEAKESWLKITGDNPKYALRGANATKDEVQKMEHETIDDDELFEDYNKEQTNYLKYSPKFLFVDAGEYSLFTLNMNSREEGCIVMTPAALFDPANNWTSTDYNQTWPSAESNIYIEKSFMNIFLGTDESLHNTPNLDINLDINHSTRWKETINSYTEKHNTKYAENKCSFDINYKRKIPNNEVKKIKRYRETSGDSTTRIHHNSKHEKLPISASNNTKTLFTDTEGSFESHLGKELGDALQAVHMYIFACIYIEYGDGITNTWEDNKNIWNFNFGKITLSFEYEHKKIVLKVENEPNLLNDSKTSKIVDEEKKKLINERKSEILMTTCDGNVAWLVSYVFRLPVYYSSGKRIFTASIDDEYYKDQQKKTINNLRRVRQTEQIVIIECLIDKLNDAIKKKNFNLIKDILSFNQDNELSIYIGVTNKTNSRKFRSNALLPFTRNNKERELFDTMIKYLNYLKMCLRYLKDEIEKCETDIDDITNELSKNDALSHDFVQIKMIKEFGDKFTGAFNVVHGQGENRTVIVIDNSIVDTIKLFEHIKEILKQYHSFEEDEYSNKLDELITKFPHDSIHTKVRSTTTHSTIASELKSGASSDLLSRARWRARCGQVFYYNNMLNGPQLQKNHFHGHKIARNLKLGGGGPEKKSPIIGPSPTSVALGFGIITPQGPGAPGGPPGGEEKKEEPSNTATGRLVSSINNQSVSNPELEKTILTLENKSSHMLDNMSLQDKCIHDLFEYFQKNDKLNLEELQVGGVSVTNVYLLKENGICANKSERNKIMNLLLKFRDDINNHLQMSEDAEQFENENNLGTEPGPGYDEEAEQAALDNLPELDE